MSRTRMSVLAFALIAIAAAVAAGATAATGKRASAKAEAPVKVQVFAPRPGDVVGKQSRGFFVDLALEYPSLASSRADLQLTGRGRIRTWPPSPVPSRPASTRSCPA